MAPRRRPHPAGLAAVLVVAALLAGCGDDADPTAAPTPSQVPTGTSTGTVASGAACDALAAVERATDDVRALDSDSTIDEAQQAVEDLTTSVRQLRDDGGIRATAATALVAASEAVSGAVDSLGADVSGSETLGEAATAVQAAAGALSSAVDSAKDDVRCD